MRFICDRKRHLVCIPYSEYNLFKMAFVLGIDRCWFHKDHFDIPKRRMKEIMEHCEVVSPKTIVSICRTGTYKETKKNEKTS